MYGEIVPFVLLIAWSVGAVLPPEDLARQFESFRGSRFEYSDSNIDVVDQDSLGIKFKDNNSYVEENVHYYLYTREYWEPYEITKNDSDLLSNSTFNSSLPTMVICHGFMNSYLDEMEQMILDAYLYNQDVNVVAVSWEKLAGSLLHYSLAASYTKAVGKEIAVLIDFLVSAGGADISSFHLIGHSLGAHVVSFASNYVTSGNITRISGLDPALPDFNGVDTDSRLDPSDADLVDCIHTCGGLYGYYDPLCDVDFYPNGGQPVQPGCWWFHLVGVCSHGRAYELFAASLNTTFEAEFCDTFEHMVKKNCSSSDTGLMGEPTTSAMSGIYYLKTTGSYPYVKNSTVAET